MQVSGSGEYSKQTYQGFGVLVVCQSILGAVSSHPVRGSNDDLGSSPDELTECFGEGQVPADEDTDGAEGRLDDVVGTWSFISLVFCSSSRGGVHRRRQVRTLRVPEVGLRVGAQDLTRVADEG